MEYRRLTFADVRIDTLPEARPLRFEECVLSNSSVGSTARRPTQRLVLRNVFARQCTIDSVSVGPLIFDDVTVHGLRTTTHLWLPACAFRHCILRGRIGRLLFFAGADPAKPLSEPQNAAFLEANGAFYAETDWALDISEATFVDWDCRSIPASLIRPRPVKWCTSEGATVHRWARFRLP